MSTPTTRTPRLAQRHASAWGMADARPARRRPPRSEIRQGLRHDRERHLSGRRRGARCAAGAGEPGMDSAASCSPTTTSSCRAGIRSLRGRHRRRQHRRGARTTAAKRSPSPRQQPQLVVMDISMKELNASKRPRRSARVPIHPRPHPIPCTPRKNSSRARSRRRPRLPGQGLRARGAGDGDRDRMGGGIYLSPRRRPPGSERPGASGSR